MPQIIEVLCSKLTTPTIFGYWIIKACSFIIICQMCSTVYIYLW